MGLCTLTKTETIERVEADRGLPFTFVAPRGPSSLQHMQRFDQKIF